MKSLISAGNDGKILAFVDFEFGVLFLLCFLGAASDWMCIVFFFFQFDEGVFVIHASILTGGSIRFGVCRGLVVLIV